MNLIALNGPAGCGKDTAASLLAPAGYSNYKISSSLKQALANLLPGSVDIERSKDMRVGNLSVREALISLSEDWVKPTFGEAWFGQLLAANLPPTGWGCISDSRFLPELKPIIDAHCVVVVRIHRIGHTFSGDSGSYIYPSFTQSFDVPNNGTREDLLVCLEKILIQLGWPTAGA